MSRLLIFSSDTHAGAPPEEYREYLDADLRDDYDQVIAGLDEGTSSDETDPERVAFGTHLELRLDRLEKEAIVGEVLFPDPGRRESGIPFAGAFGAAQDTSFEWLSAGYQAHNRWLADHVDPDRQVGLAVVAHHDVEAAVATIRWASQHGLRGILLDGMNPALPPFHDSCYDPMWSACEEAGMPVHWHGGGGVQGFLGATGVMSDGSPVVPFSAAGVMDLAFYAQRPLWFMIGGGVLDRHPDLRIVFTEIGANWAARAMTRFDWFWEKRGMRLGCPRKPSEYFGQVFFGFSNVSRHEVEVRHEVGVERLMWGTDHPHTGSAWAVTLPWARAIFGATGLPLDQARAILGENAVRLYGLDHAKLEALAARVGPRVEEVLTPPTEHDLADPVIELYASRPTE